MWNFLGKLWKLCYKMNLPSYFCQKNILIAWIIRLSISFSSLDEIEWIESFHVEKNTSCEQWKFYFDFMFFFYCSTNLVLSSGCHNFCSWVPSQIKIIFLES